MKTEHPITPPLELVEEWRIAPEYTSGREKLTMVTMTTRRLQEIANQAALWGSDHELEACCEYLTQCAAWEPEDVQEMRDLRRPKPPSLKQQALQALANADGADHPVVTTVLTADQHALIRKALEQLDD